MKFIILVSDDRCSQVKQWMCQEQFSLPNSKLLTTNANICFNLQAFLFIAVCLAVISAMPADESIISDNVDAFHPADESQFIKKKLLLKKLIILKKKKLLFG